MNQLDVLPRELLLDLFPDPIMVSLTSKNFFKLFHEEITTEQYWFYGGRSEVFALMTLEYIGSCPSVSLVKFLLETHTTSQAINQLGSMLIDYWSIEILEYVAEKYPVIFLKWSPQLMNISDDIKFEYINYLLQKDKN